MNRVAVAAAVIGSAAVAAPATSAGGGGSASFPSHRLCARLLTAAAVGGNATVERIADAYVELLTGPGAGLVSLEELRAMLESGRFFELPDGSSARDHVGDGLREIGAITRRSIRDQRVLAAELRARLAKLVSDASGSEDRRRMERERRRAPRAAARTIPLPPTKVAHPTVLVHAVAPDGSRALVAQNDGLTGTRYWILETGMAGEPRLVPCTALAMWWASGAASGAAFSEDGALLSFRAKNGINVIDAATGATLGVFGAGRKVSWQKVVPGGKSLVYGIEENSRRSWFVADLASKETREFPLSGNFLLARQKNPILERAAIEFAADGSVAALRSGLTFAQGGEEHLFYHVWRLADAALLDSFADASVGIRHAFHVAPHGDFVLASIVPSDGGSETLSIGDIGKGRWRQLLRGSREGGVHNAAYSPRSGIVAGLHERVSGYYVRLWDARTGDPIVSGHPLEINRSREQPPRLRFSGDGERLEALLKNGEKLVWSIPDGQLLAHYSEPPASPAGISRDGSVLLTLLRNAVRVYYVNEILGVER